jgi:hypothetical protein
VIVVRNRLCSPGLRRGTPPSARVAGDHDDEVVAVVLHLLDQGVDGLVAVLVPRERVRLVDEQDAAERVFDDLGGLDRRLPR